MQVTELTCEYRKEPLGIDVPAPRFTWKLTDRQNTRGQKQTAYRVLVASSREALKQNQGDLWDSKIVTSNQSALVVYAGKSLQSNQSCYWKVQSYDKDNHGTAWSAVAHFTTGLFSAADWKGQWIKYPDTSRERHIWFRKSFSLDEPVKAAMVYVASIGYHELYVNGTKADTRILSPSLTRIDKRVLYIAYDVGPWLKKGKNTIALWYGAGWSRFEAFRQKIAPAIKVQMNATTQSGKDFALCSDSTWKFAFSSSQYIGGWGLGDYGGELVDGRSYLPEWNKNTFNNDGWNSCATVQLNVTLSSQAMEPTRIVDTLRAQGISDTAKGYYCVDMGRNFTGWIHLSLSRMSAGDTVEITVADNSETAQSFGQKNLYICTGKRASLFAIVSILWRGVTSAFRG